MSNRPKSPLLATINITGFCNLECKYCFYHPRNEVNISKVDFIKAVEILKEQEIFLLSLSGGEVFLHPEINSFLKIAHDSIPYVLTLSNGTLINDSNLKTISSIIEKNGAFQIQISIDSIDSETNSKTRSTNEVVVKNIKRLNEIGAYIIGATVITSYNINSLPETILKLSDLIDSFHIIPFKQNPFSNKVEEEMIADSDKIVELWNKLIEMRIKYGLKYKTPYDENRNLSYCATGAPCMAGFSQIVIDADLKVRPCDRCTKTFVGDLNFQDFNEVWNSKELLNVINRDSPICQTNNFA